MAQIYLQAPFDHKWVQTETQSTTLADLLCELADKFPGVWSFDTEEVSCVISLNGQAPSALVNGLNTRLKDNDEVQVDLIPITGG